ncbi:STM4012 family radical SAM protein [Anatilimnocola floriformis]|uniref:STM4012 family radical SAM protein n=1 Tax=Anatilimnocola floriformis TaxID=2948575 RepID=UPI0020C46BF3|nr:STM4012 family radical SAM protein [Anatilimnocola floriformis]
MSMAGATKLADVLTGSPYVGYSYAYPHKTAYRRLAEPLPLQRVWQAEPSDSLFLYVHIPFCEYRCGFCNLFTLSQPADSLTTRYLAALEREADAYQETLAEPQFSRLAIGGGTPTFLTIAELDRLFQIIERFTPERRIAVPLSCEGSPATLTAEKLALLRERGTTRFSLGIQSFEERDLQTLGRPQKRAEVEQALALLAAHRFPVTNLDLIYGSSSQTLASWLATIERAVAFAPEEIYLYPLYVRPLTGLARLEEWDDWRLLLYRAGRDKLLEAGYQQTSMRMFTRAADETAGPTYCCQSDGMVGLGCGARSYTHSLHYSREYAVKSANVAGILADYIGKSMGDFGAVEFGATLDEHEQRRRVLILSLLQAEGLRCADYAKRFGSEALADFPELYELLSHKLAEVDGDCLRLTPAGLERSDAIGPWLYSATIAQQMEEYAWR